MLTERHAGVAVTTQIVDVGDEEAVDSGFDAAVRAHGQVDAVFANAAVGGGGDPFSMPTEVWRNSLRVNLDGVFFIFRATLVLSFYWTSAQLSHGRVTGKAGGYLKERGEGGSLVATGSLAGEQGVPFNLAYASAKVRSAFVCTSPPSFDSS